jgi:hypothetical protein
MKKRLIGALTSIPLTAALTMSGDCAASCPYGLVNDPYPGQCPRYVDLNGDGLCDFSQAAAAISTTPDSTTISSIDQTNHGHGGVSDVVSPDQDVTSNASLVTDTGSGLDASNLPGGSGGYNIIPISILLISGYLFTHYLFSKGILKRDKHRKIWNLLVTAGYFGTGVTGVLLIFMINLGIRTVLNPSITFLHAELAILMVVGTLIHIHLYRKPFKKMFKLIFSFKSVVTKKKSGKTSGIFK